MDKQLIERIAPLVQAAIEQGPLFPEQGERQSLAESITALVIERIDAERGKKAACVVDFAKQGWRDFIESIRVFPDGTPLFLSPTIPEGMVLVPIVPTEAMVEASGAESQPGQCAYDVAAKLWAAMLAAAQGGRNAN